jgi:hypothetical protein
MTESPSRRKMLSVEQIDAAVAEVGDLAASAGARILLVGGVALNHYGSDRFTADVDFVADQPIAALPAESPLSFGGYQSHTSQGVAVDLILRDDDFTAIYEEALLHPRRLAGVPVPVVSPEYLVLMKMVARRPKDELDLETLLGLGVVDIDKTRRMVRRLLGAYAVADLDSAVQMAAWRREKPGHT